MTYSKKSECLDEKTTPLDLDQLELLEPGDRLIVENHMPGGGKIYTRGILRSGFKVLPYPPSLCINNELTERGGHSCTTLYSTWIDSSGKYKKYGDKRSIYRDPSGKYKKYGDKRSIYRDPDLETDRQYSYQVETQIAGKGKAFGLISRRLDDLTTMESKAQGLESINLRDLPR
jgi:hypothetical protein